MARSKSNLCRSCGAGLAYGTKGGLCRSCWRREQAPAEPLNPSGLCMCGCGQPAPIATQSEHKRGYRLGEPLRYIAGHMQLRTQEAYRVEDRGYSGGPCWIWQRYINDQGYGVVGHKGGTVRAHREMYEKMVRPIPEGLELDHLCRVRSCVNPDHLEPVTSAENIRRNESPTSVTVREGRCRRGHDLSGPDAVYVHTKTGKRQCKACNRLRQQKRAIVVDIEEVRM